ncbi:hypothetical protein [Leptospira sp. GIMC2001]|uniref:hypothetical protein n=1 Tax=Leptospira sp. GIMC2001 TaxID=1513297 RepID=UPI00234AF81A|nr:hypothetical protein [Leptospira sp. GIMC2001]WCL50748.1 hypothetical protein O4O04_08030 [Leptospira sp. GIMC2001]
MQTKILYYDKKVEEACFDICEKLQIDNMPDYDNKSYHKLVDNKFKRIAIPDSMKLPIYGRIFEESVFPKFETNKHNVLFVFDGKILKGIVHFADYNHDKVLKNLQDDILNFELNLRQLLVIEKLSNLDLIKYFKNKRDSKNTKSSDYSRYDEKINRFEKTISNRDYLSEFQTFDISDLLNFCNSDFSKKIFPLEKVKIETKKFSPGEIIRNLRNTAMHGKDPIGKDEAASIYSMESLSKFLTNLKIFRQLANDLEEKIKNHDDYRKSIQLENQSKLNIIHAHHPSALNYFLSR